MILNAFRLALREIGHNLMRSFLTTLGIAIGIAAVIAMVTLGRAATQSVTSSISSMGQNLLIVTPGERRPGTFTSAPPFQMRDVEAIRREIPALAVAAPVVQRSTVVVNGNHSRTTPTTGTTNDFLISRDWPVVEGRTFTEGEMTSGKAACILGETVRRDLLPGQDALGATIRVGKIPCLVVGVLLEKGQSAVGMDQDDVVIMPIRAVQRRIAGNEDVSMIWCSIADTAQTETTKAQITALLRQIRHVGHGVADDFQVNDLQEVTRLVQSTSGDRKSVV